MATDMPYTATEFEPVMDSDNTELKVPISPDVSLECTAPTPGQKICAMQDISYFSQPSTFDLPCTDTSPQADSQNSTLIQAAQISPTFDDSTLGMMAQSGQHDELLSLLDMSELNSTAPGTSGIQTAVVDELQELPQLLEFARDLPREKFVNRILLKYEQCEAKLDLFRNHLFNSLKKRDTFPYGTECELKRRLNMRNSDPACVKLAYDVHTLVLVIDGADISSIKDIISLSRKQSRLSSVPQSAVKSRPLHADSSDKCSCSTELNCLKDEISNMRADMLLFKQRQAADENHKSSERIRLNTTICTLQDEIATATETLQNSIGSLTERVVNIEHLSHQKIMQCKTFVSNNSKTILDLQVSLMRVKTSLESMTNTFNTSLANLSGKDSDVLSPCTPYVTQTHTQNTDEAALFGRETQPKDKSAHKSTQTVPAEDKQAQSSTPIMVSNLHSNPNVLPAYLANLIDLEDSDTHPATNSTQIVDHSTIEMCDNTEGNLYFGNAKIPDAPHKGGNSDSGRHEHNRLHRNINFTMIRKDIENSTKRKRQNRSPNLTHSDETNVANVDGFAQYVRKRPRRYFIGGLVPSDTESKVAQYISDQGLKVTKVTIFRKHRDGQSNVFACINVEDDGYTGVMTEDPLFWPRGVTCRPWLTRFELRQKRYRYLKGKRSYSDKRDSNISQTNEYDAECYNPYSALNQDNWAID